MEIILTNRIDQRLLVNRAYVKLISMKNLSPMEINLSRQYHIKRMFLPELAEKDRNEYFIEFERFWNEVVKKKSSMSAFWRNGLSSKMQEWEKSVGYLTLILFTLNTLCTASDRILFVVSSIEEFDLVECWGKINQWNMSVYRSGLEKRFLGRFKQEIVNCMNLLKLSYGFIQKKRCLKKPGIINDRKKRILIVSRFQEESFRANTYTDPYWGKIHDVCHSQGYNVTYLFNAVGKKGYNKYQSCNGQLEALFPLSVISWWQMLSSILKVSVRGYRAKQKKFIGCNFTRVLNWHFRKFDHAFNLISEFYFSAIKQLGRRSGYEKLLCLYEGNNFERACIQAFDKHIGGTTIGYCHGVLYPINLKIRRLSGEVRKPRAKHYFCTGPKSKEALMAVGGNRKPDLIRSGCTMRYIPEMNVLKTFREKTNILVALDGVWSSVSMLDWLFENEQLFGKYKITLRSHPNVPLATLLGLCLQRKSDRFIASNSTLKEDLSDCFCVIYRQSSVGMQAILHDIPIIHLKIDAPLPCDPILKAFNGKWTVQTADDMSMALRDIRNLTQSQIKDMMSDGKKYIERYFAQSNKQILSKFIENTHF